MAETSDRVSSLAARYTKITAAGLRDATMSASKLEMTAADIRTMAASLLRQDTTKGLRGLLKRIGI